MHCPGHLKPAASSTGTDGCHLANGIIYLEIIMELPHRRVHGLDSASQHLGAHGFKRSVDTAGRLSNRPFRAWLRLEASQHS